MGHAFNTALIDRVVRFQSLRGKNVLPAWHQPRPIAAQTILEKRHKAEGPQQGTQVAR